MNYVGRRLRSRWVAASVVAAAFIVLGHPSAAVAFLFAWMPPSLALLALRIGPRVTVDPRRPVGST